MQTSFPEISCSQGGEHNHLCLNAQFVTSGEDATSPPLVKNHFAILKRRGRGIPRHSPFWDGLLLQESKVSSV